MDTAQRGRTGVLLVNTGSPTAPTPEAVRAYLEAFLMDDRIRPLPAPLWGQILRRFILPRRSEASAAKYRSVWREDGAPLIAHCRRLAGAVERVLAGTGAGAPAAGATDEAGTTGAVGAAGMRGAGWMVRATMLYGRPGIADTLDELRRDGCEQLVIVPLYPQTAFSTTGAVHDACERALAAARTEGWNPAVAYVNGYGDEPAYVDAVAQSLRAAGYRPADDYLLLTYHAVPLPDVRRGDTYPVQVERSSRAIARAAGAAPDAWTWGYQSPFEDGRRWTTPFTSTALRAMAQGSRRLVACCPGFSVDCLETLYDVEQEYRSQFCAARGDADAFRYVPCLNAAPDHARLIARLAVSRAPGRATRPNLA